MTTEITNLPEEAGRLHREAMDLAEQAEAKRRAGDHAGASDLYTAAYRAEREAAELVRDMPDLEPTRSVLFGSAATLALECGELTEARVCAHAGLDGNPPAEIEAELQDALGKARFQPKDRVRHKFHPEWGMGVVTSVGRKGNPVVADWQYHVQQVPLPPACLVKVAKS